MDEKVCRKVMDEMRFELEKLITLESTDNKELIILISQELDEVIIQYIKLNKEDHTVEAVPMAHTKEKDMC